MDLQGTPIGSTGQGMKNTSDSESYQNPTQEGTGAVASDSVAAESARSGGGFSENRDGEPLAVKGSQSTLNNTDTSAATTLPPASDAQEHDHQTGGQETASGQKYPEGSGGQGSFPGQHSDQGYVGGSTNEKRDFSSGNDNTLSGGGQTSDHSSITDTTSRGPNLDSSSTDTTSSPGVKVDEAPGYVASVYSEPNNSGKPHGTNINEGGFDADDAKNASFNSDIGSKDDPGRDALKQMQDAYSGSGPKQPLPGQGLDGEGVGTGIYDNLRSEERS